jgi:hypothetical protein
VKNIFGCFCERWIIFAALEIEKVKLLRAHD